MITSTDKMKKNDISVLFKKINNYTNQNSIILICNDELHNEAENK